MATINYNGMELEEFISAEPKIFSPPTRMVVWDEEFNKFVEDVYVYDPRRKDSYYVVTATASWLHCALLPDTPKPRRATNRELSRWLALGNGECLGSQDDADTAWNYPMECSNMPLRDGAKVRKWSDTEWHEPTVDYLRLEDV